MAWKDLIAGIRSKVSGWVPFGGTIMTPTDDDLFVIGSIHQMKGASFAVPDLETLADIPYEILDLGMSVTVVEHTRPGGGLVPRTRYALNNLPPEGTKVSEVPSYKISDYWGLDDVQSRVDGEYETEYAPNYENKRPPFLPNQISKEAYNAGYATDDDFSGGNPGDKIWSDTYEPSEHRWLRQRINDQADWGIPLSIDNTNYEDGQFIDVKFQYISPKGGSPPTRPPSINDAGESNNNPSGWIDTPGDNYDTEITTKDLYRTQVLKDPFGNLKGDWSIPIIVSSNPLLVRYGNTPGNSDFLNDSFWRGYYTPGLDIYIATRPDSGSTNWTVQKIDNESGEYREFVFKLLPIGASNQDIIDATPTFPNPLEGTAPNDWSDAPVQGTETEILYMSQTIKNIDGSFKSGGWSLPRRFDGLDRIQAIIEETPGDTFYNVRVDGTIQQQVAKIDLVAKLYKGPSELTTGINGYKWYRGATQITFDSGTRLATNLGVGLNAAHQVSVDGKTLSLLPAAVSNTQEYKVGIDSNTRASDYLDNIQIKDATDDGVAYVADILPESGTTFKNGLGLYKFDAQFINSGVVDNTGVTFEWSIVDAQGNTLTDGIKDDAGDTLGDTDVEAATVYVDGDDVDQYATLKLKATFGAVIRNDQITLTDVEDASQLEVLYWGSGDTNPGNPTDFSPRTLTKQQVLDLAIGYTENAAGKWFAIFKTEGEWGGEIQLRGETPKPSGGISFNVFKNVDFDVDGPPAQPSVPASGSIIPSGWTATPTAYTGNQDVTYQTTCIFLLRTDVDADPTDFTRDNYNPSGSYGTPVRISGIDGDTPPPVDDGEDGWTPVIAVVNDGSRRVLKVIEWIGGEGTPPPANSSTSYIGSGGLTTKGAATNVRGPAGESVNVRPAVFVEAGQKLAGTYPTLSVNTTQGNWRRLQNVVLANNWNQPREFILYGQVFIHEDSGSAGEAYDLIFDQDVSRSGTLPADSGTRAAHTHRETGPHFVKGVGGDIEKTKSVELHGSVTVPANSTWRVYFTIKQVYGTLGRASVGYMRAFGI